MPHAIEIDPTVERWIIDSVPRTDDLQGEIFYDIGQKIQHIRPNLGSVIECFQFGVEFGKELAVQKRKEGNFKEKPGRIFPESWFQDEKIYTKQCFQETLGAVGYCIDELSIPSVTKDFLRGSIDHVEWRFSNDGCHLTTFEDGKICITLNLYDLHMKDRVFPHVYGEPESEQFSRGSRIMLISHELGHAIAMSLSENRKSFEQRAPVKYGKQGMKGYPLTFYPPVGFDNSNTVEHVYLQVTQNERFASYFSSAVQEGLGLSHHILVDEALGFLVQPYELGLTMIQLQYVLFGVQLQIEHEFSSYEEKEQYGLHRMKVDFYESLYKNDGMTMLFPFSRPMVEKVITKAWRKLVASSFKYIDN